MNTEKTDFTQGSILKKLSLFMLPVLGAQSSKDRQIEAFERFL